VLVRQELREQKRRGYLDAAVRIIVRDGLDGLTMNAIAREVDAAVGTIYGYFSHKSALVTELQVLAIEVLVGSWGVVSAEWDQEFCAAELTEGERDLARILAYAEYFADLASIHPEEFRLQQLQLAQPQALYDEDDLSRLAPATADLVRCPFRVIHAAAGHGSIGGSDRSFERALSLALLLNGIALVGNVAYAVDHCNPRHLMRSVVADLVLGWGADPETVSRAQSTVRAVCDARPVASVLVPTTLGPSVLAASPVSRDAGPTVHGTLTVDLRVEAVRVD